MKAWLRHYPLKFKGTLSSSVLHQVALPLMASDECDRRVAPQQIEAENEESCRTRECSDVLTGVASKVTQTLTFSVTSIIYLT
jgi:hypothetical protein